MDDLLTRLREATGGDRELDARLWCALDEGNAIFSHLVGGGEVAIYFLPDKPGSRRCPGWPPYTSSVDAALALIARVLPGWLWSVSGPDLLNGRDCCWAVVADKEDNGAEEPWAVDRAVFESEAPTPALALVIALVEAVKGERGRELERGGR